MGSYRLLLLQDQVLREDIEYSYFTWSKYCNYYLFGVDLLPIRGLSPPPPPLLELAAQGQECGEEEGRLSVRLGHSLQFDTTALSPHV